MTTQNVPFGTAARNAFGMIGPVDWDALDETRLREQIRANPHVRDKRQADAPRPFLEELARVGLSEEIGRQDFFVSVKKAAEAFEQKYGDGTPEAAKGPAPVP